MLAVLRFWQLAVGAIGAFGLSYLLHTVDVDRIEKKQRDVLAAQAIELTTKCDSDKKITLEASNDLQSKISALNSELISVKRLHPSSCIVPVRPADATRCNDGAAARKKPPTADAGVTSDALYDYAGEAEKYRLQLISCQGFVRKVWEARK